MKKSITATLVLVVICVLAGCSSNNSGTANTYEVDALVTKVYKIATDTNYIPFEFEDENGNMIGIDLDILAAIAQDQGFQYELQVIGFAAAITALESGESDAMIAGIAITEDRVEKYDFSEAYYESGVGMGVLSGSDVKTYEDLAGKQVAAKTGTEACTFALYIADKYGFTVAEFEDSPTMYQNVLSGNSAACFEDYSVLGYEISKGLSLAIPTDLEQSASYGLATLKGANSELVVMFNAGLKNIKANGKYDEIINTYISR